MNRLLIISALSILLSSCIFLQENKQQNISLDEPDAPQPVIPIQNWNKIKEVQISWGSSYERYHREYIPKLEISDQILLTGWKNERLNAQAVVWTTDSIKNLNVQLSDLKSQKGDVLSKAINHYFVRNVISDEFLGGCGYKTKSQETAHLVPDCLEEAAALTICEKSTRSIWFNIEIPPCATPGSYSSTITIKAGDKTLKSLKLNIDVLNRTLPNPQNWNYQLDLWQNPYSVARIHNVPLWSDEHFEKMTPLFKMLANAGQKSITATILPSPWGGQTYDSYESMIKHTLKQDGSWEFNYSIFDKWVEFMMELGVKEQIKCFSLIPWENQLGYYDEKFGKDTLVVAPASSVEFKNYWTPFLIDFKKHLINKGWFDITSISMDERPIGDMKEALKLIHDYGNFKISSAANYSPKLANQIFDLSVESRHIMPDSIIQDRRNQGQISTYYVCCSAEYPNNFTYSEPAEGVWQAWYAYSKNLDGFLRWAYNSWAEDPIHDTRYITWPAGDTFFVYPDAKSSIRFEKLREGIQDFEKLIILENELGKSNKPEAQIHIGKIHELLKEFEISSIKNNGCKDLILKGKKLLNNI